MNDPCFEYNFSHITSTGPHERPSQLYLQNLCLPAIAVVDEVSEDPEFIQQIMNGVYTHVYGSPECLLASKTWRDLFSCTTFCERLIGVAIDEANCTVQW